jgi:tetratricopeptide (TPR) repeat protein
VGDSARQPEWDRLSLAASLLRPFIDLEPCRRGPLYARGLEQYWNAFADTERPRFVLQRTLPRTFRTHLLRETGFVSYEADDPREVPGELWSTRWSTMCEALDAWPELTADHQCRLVLLLHALCFYELILTLLPDRSKAQVAESDDHNEFAYWRASARYVFGLADRVADYDADLSELGRIATTAPRHDPAAFNASLKILTHKAKTGAPADELLKWRAHTERILDSVITKADGFMRTLLLSRFYRAAAFVPQRARDRREVVRMMDLAEYHARAMRPLGETQELVYLENLHPLMESRAKEALWLGDLDLALERALVVVGLDAYDSRAWLEVGEVRLRRKEHALAAEAYAVAATLGPPSSAIARHMAGLCFRDLAQPLLAAFFFKGALDVDPQAISPREELLALPDVPVLIPLKEWSLDSFRI